MSALRTVALRNLRAHKVRLALTVISVLLGTAFVAGSLVFTDTLKESFDTIFTTSDKGIDARVEARHDYSPGVPVGELAALRQVPGVAAVQPTISAPLVLVDGHGKKIDTGGAPSEGSYWLTGQTVQAKPTLVAGRAPTRGGEVAINNGAMSRYHLHVGDRVRAVVSNSPVTTARIVGTYRISFDTGGYLGALFSRDQALALFSDGAHYTGVDLAARAGVSEQTLAASVARTLPADLKVRTGTQVRDDDSQGVAAALSFVTYILLGFGIIALLVGTFIIYNTFSMIVAQRQRELALLRAIGAERRQIRRSVLLEAAVIGIVGSGLGLAGGIGLAYGLHALLDALNLGLPAGGLVLSVRTVLVAVLLGTVVTVVAASTPARRAGRIAPVAAMRAEFASPSAAGLRRRTVLGVLLGAAGALATVAGATADKSSSGSALIGLGLVAACAAAMLLSPVFARWVIAPIGRLAGRGVVARLARTNAVRNPRRTAATAFALALGLVLVSGIAVLGTSMKASINKLFDDNVTADYILTTDVELALPPAGATAARTVPGVASVTELHTLDARVDGTGRSGTALDGPLAAVVRVHMQTGTFATSGGRMVVSHQEMSDRHWTIGSRHIFEVPGHTPITLTIAGVYQDDNLIGPWVVSGDVYRALTPRNDWGDDVALVHARPGTDLTALRTGLDRATNDLYVVQVRNRTQYEGMIASQVNGLLALLYGLLGLAIVIAVLGIVNTQALSVVERRRELGMLRAVGMQRAQVRRTVYLESLLIAVFGAVLGVSLGTGFGVLFSRTLLKSGLQAVVRVPWTQAGLFLVLAALIGVLAALWPGFRASRTAPLEAIAEE